MPKRESSWPRRAVVTVLGFALLGAAVGWLGWLLTRGGPPDDDASPAPVERSRPALPPPVVHDAQSAPAPERTAIAPAAELDPTPDEPLDFRAAIERLCEHGLRTAELAQDDEFEAAQREDAAARELMSELLADHPDAGEQAIGLLVEDSAPLARDPSRGDPPRGTGRSRPENTRLAVLQAVLHADLSRRHERTDRGDDRARLDALVQALLDTAPIDARTSEMVDRCLHGQPFLGLPHEPTVLHLLEQASAGEFSRDVATRLLLTLWDNLQATGARSSDELSRLALLQLDDVDPSRVLAACRRLLQDPRHRDLVLAWLRERGDRALAADVARHAAGELEPRAALDVLRALQPLLEHTRGCYLGIGIRAPDVLADAYREHLAMDNQPGVRRELVMGIGMLPDPVGLEIARFALENDPAPEVRIQAMFAFTVHGSPADAEGAVSRLLDEPAIAGSPRHLGAVVLALENLEHGDPNTVARLGQRLRTLPLDEQGRERLDGILARSLPGGRPPGEAARGR